LDSTFSSGHPDGDYHFEPAQIQEALGGRYAVGSRIARGGQGVVFRATRNLSPDGVATNDDIALKMYFQSGQSVRVKREIDAMEQIAHPNLAKLVEHGYCEVAGQPTQFLAWQFIQGLPLNRHLRGGPLLESEVLAIGCDIAAAIAEIWSRQIVHGDIKPPNIMLPHPGSYIMTGAVNTAVLIDLGVATYLNLENSRGSLEPRSLARARLLAMSRPAGTMGYFSPEQLGGVKALTCASDVFSLGVVMLQCLLGRHPTDYDQNALAQGIPASNTRVPASAPLLGILNRMLAVSPTSRPNPADLSRQLRALRETRQMKR